MKATWLEDGEEGVVISASELASEGIESVQIPTENYQERLEQLKKQWGYSAHDEVSLTPETPNLEAICAKFDKEHLHTDDEVRYILEGDGYFDIRSQDDRWMHVHVEVGDFILVPADRCHRFYLTDKKRIVAVRLFKDNPSWTPIYRTQ